MHVTIDLFTIEDELMPCWGSTEGGILGEPHYPRYENHILVKPDCCPECAQRIGYYTSYSS